MSDLFENPMAGVNEPEFSVSEISNAIKRLIEDEFSYLVENKNFVFTLHFSI